MEFLFKINTFLVYFCYNAFILTLTLNIFISAIRFIILLDYKTLSIMIFKSKGNVLIKDKVEILVIQCL